MSEIKMKPCPFCGSEARVAKGIKGKLGFWHGLVVCNNFECGAGVQGMPCFEADEAEREAAERWNRRAERTCRFEREFVEAAKDWYCRCSECGQVFPYYSLADRLRFCPNCGARVVEG